MTAIEFATGGVWFMLYAFATCLAVRLSPDRSPAVLVIALACLFTLASLPAGALAPVEGNYWRALTAFTFLTLCHLIIFGITYKSISLRILLDLSQAPSTRLPADLVFSRYIERESFAARIQVMTTQGLASHSLDGITLTPKGHRLAASAELLQRLYDIQISG